MKSLGRWISDTLLESGVLEHAMSRRDYKMRVSGQVNNIIENWCMIRLARKTGHPTLVRCIDHWKDELLTAMSAGVTVMVKSGDKRNMLDDVIEMHFGDIRKGNDPREARENVSKIMKVKMRKEKIISPDIIRDLPGIINDFINEIYIIFNKIKSDDPDTIADYVDGL